MTLEVRRILKSCRLCKFYALMYSLAEVGSFVGIRTDGEYLTAKFTVKLQCFKIGKSPAVLLAQTGGVYLNTLAA